MIIAVSLIKIKIIIRVVIIYTTKPIIELKINADTIKIHTSKITKSNSFAKGLISLTSNMQIRYHIIAEINVPTEKLSLHGVIL